MAAPNTKCKVCGKEYFCCSDSRQIGSWRTMACSIECYKEYMRRIENSRRPVVEEKNITATSELKVTEKISKSIKKKIITKAIKPDDVIKN